MMIKAILLFLLLVAAFPAFAQDEGILWGYSSGEEKMGFGSNSSNAMDGGAIYVPAEVARQYAGNQVTAVKARFATDVTQVTFFVTANLDGEPITQSAMLSAASAGWTEQPLSSAYTITGDPFYVGYTCRGYNPVSLSSNQVTNGAWIRQYDTWSNLAFWGTVNLSFRIKGDNMPADATLEAFATEYAKTGEPVNLTFNVHNLTTAIDGFTLEGGVDDGETVAQTYHTSLASGESTTVQFTLPPEQQEGEKTVKVYIKALGTKEDSNKANDTLKATVRFKDYLFERNIVVEEQSGTWCGNCPRAIYALEHMEELYADKGFIGISYYNDDRPENIELFSSNYPSLRMNGVQEVGSVFAELEQTFLAAPRIAEAGLSINAARVGDKLRLSSTAQFDASHSNADYRVLYIVLENEVEHAQRNYSSGGDRAVAGYFVDLPSVCVIQVDHVARGIYPSIRGEAGSLPASLEKGVCYHHGMTLPVPSTIKNADKTEVVALLFNAATSEFVNAARTTIIDGTGDVNADCNVSLSDLPALIELLLSHNTSLTAPFDLQAADVNADENVSVSDLTALRSILLKNVNE